MAPLPGGGRRDPDSQKLNRPKAWNGEREALLLEGLGLQARHANVADDLEPRSAHHRSFARDQLDLHFEDAGNVHSKRADLLEAQEPSRPPATGGDDVGRRNPHAVEVDELSAASHRAVAEAAAAAHEDRLATADRCRLAARGLEVEPLSPAPVIVVLRPGGPGERREGRKRRGSHSRPLEELSSLDLRWLHD